MADKIPEKGGHIPPHIARKKPDCDTKPEIPDPCKIRDKVKRKATIREGLECIPIRSKTICPTIKTIEHVAPLLGDDKIVIETPPGEPDQPPPLIIPQQIGNTEVILSCPSNQTQYDALECAGTDGIPEKDSAGNFPEYGSSVRIAPNTFFVLLAAYTSEAEAQAAVNAIATAAACDELDCWFLNDEELGSCDDLLTAADIAFLHSLSDRALDAQITEHEIVNPDLDYTGIKFTETTGDMDHSMIKGPGMLDGGDDNGTPTRTAKILVPGGVFLSKVSKEEAQQQAKDLRDENLVASCYKCNPALEKPCPVKAEPKDGFFAPECSFLGNPWDAIDTTASQFKGIQGRAIDFLAASQCITIVVPTIEEPCEPTFTLINPNEKEDCGDGDAEYKKGDESGPFDKENECDYALELPKIPCPCGYTVKLEVKQAPGASSVGSTIVSQSDNDCTMHLIIWIPEIPDFDPDIFEEQWFINIVTTAVNAAGGNCEDGYTIKLDLKNPNCSGTAGTGDSTKPANHPDNGGPGALCTNCEEGLGPDSPEWTACSDYENGDSVSYDGNCYEVVDADLVNHEDNCSLDPESGLGEAGWAIGTCGNDCFNRPPVAEWAFDLTNQEPGVLTNFTVQIACPFNQQGEEQTFPDPAHQWIEAWWEFNGGEPPAWAGGEALPEWQECVAQWQACSGYVNGDVVVYNNTCYMVIDAASVGNNCNIDPEAGLGEGGWATADGCKIYAAGDTVSFNGSCYKVANAELVASNCNLNPEQGLGEGGWALEEDCGCPDPYSLGDVVTHDGKCYEVIDTNSANEDCTKSPDNNATGWKELDECGGEQKQKIDLDNPSVAFSKDVTNFTKVTFMASDLPDEVPVWIYIDQPEEDEPCELPLQLEFPDICGELKTTSISEAGGETPKDEDGEDVSPPEDTGIVTIKSSKKEDVDGEGETNKVLANLGLTKRKVTDPETGEPCCEFGIKADNEIIISEGDICEDLDVKGVDDSELCVKVKQLQKDPNGDGPETVVVNTLVLRKIVDEDGECKLGFQSLEGEGGEPLEEGEGGGTAEAVNEILLPPESDVDPCDMINVSEDSEGTVRLLQKDPDESDPDADPVEKGTLKLVKFEEKDDDDDVIGCSFGIAANVPGVEGDVNEITLSVGGGDVCAAIEAHTDSPRTINVSVAAEDAAATPIGALTIVKTEEDDKCKLGLKYDGSASGQPADGGELIIPCAYADSSSSEITLIDDSGATIPGAIIKLESSKDANNNDVFKLTPSSITIPTMSGYEEAEIDVCTPSGIERKTILVKI